MLTGKTTRKSGVYHSDLGTFYIRKGTLDFQFGNSAYEWNVKEFVNMHISKCNKFLDIGANIGTYTILFGKAGLEGCSFEPVNENFNALKKNVELNNIKNKVKLFKLGLGEFSENDEFIFDPINTGATHLSSIDNPNAIKGKKEIVSIVPFDSIYSSCEFDTNKDTILMKIDVEGMELSVIKGAANFLKEFPEIIMVVETIHSGKENIKNELLKIDKRFNFVEVDDLNMGVIKSSKRKN
jgi:FkbM family methyltransferase